nr:MULTISPECIES: HIT domain-containing protein [Microbacterium]
MAVVPRVHAQSFEKMGFDEFESTFEAAVEIMPSLRKAFDPEGMNFWWDEGAAAGQVLPHTFIELACRFQDSDYRYRPLDELPLRPDGEREAIHKRVLDEMGRDGV